MLTPATKAKLAWRCRRGMLELDLILQKFLQEKLTTLTDTEVREFERLLSTPDPTLLAWCMGHEIPEDEELAKLVALIRNQH